ncbi:hypothetical protein FRC07_008985, partial [Ceratobasidium sp. 392]
MLVKQWGANYRSGHGLTPPYAQARVRQSRFDNLMRWRTEDFVLILPVVMHIALGLFLFGLLVFLWDMNHVVALPVMVVNAVILGCYGLTTFLPLFLAFCPYNTPLSSRKLWGYSCQIFWIAVDFIFETSAKIENRGIPYCLRVEKEIIEKNTPDEVTGRALNWLIKHSENQDAVDMAIRAIARADLSKHVWDVLAESTLIVLVAQKFTALFEGILDRETEVGNNSNPVGPGVKKAQKAAETVKSQEDMEAEINVVDKEEMRSLYGRALTSIARHKLPIDAGAELGTETDLESSPGEAPNVSLTLDQIQAVMRGLQYLWHIEYISMSFQIILNHTNNTSRLHVDAFTSLLHSLPIQISYWKQDMTRTEKREVLKPFVELLNDDSWVEQLREGFPLMLAVLAISINDYPDLLTDEEYHQWEVKYESYTNLVATHLEAADKWGHSPEQYRKKPLAPRDPANQTRWRIWRAQQAARIYTIYPDLRKEHSESLLLIGLAGLLDGLEKLCLERESANLVAVTIARQLGRISLLNKSRPANFPLVLPLAFDIRAYAVDRVMKALRPSRYRDDTNILDDKTKSDLLVAFSEKLRLWVDFGAQLTPLVIEIFHTTNCPVLQKQCLISMEESFIINPSSHEWELLSAYEIPNKLVDIIGKSDLHDLRSRAISYFELFSGRLEDTHQASNQILATNTLRSITLNGHFETLVVEIVCRRGAKHTIGWKIAIQEFAMSLKNKIPPLSRDDNECLDVLEKFSRKPLDRYTPDLNRLLLNLRNKL